MTGLILTVAGLVGLAVLLGWPFIWLLLAFMALVMLWQALRPTPRP